MPLLGLFQNKDTTTAAADRKASMIEAPTATRTTTKLYDEMVLEARHMLLDKFNDTDAATTWGPVKEHADGDIQLWKGDVSGSPWQAIKVRITIAAPASALAELLSSPTAILEWDDMTASVRVVASLSGTGSVRHATAKRVFPTQARDFVMVCDTHTVDGVGIVIASRSCEHADAPEGKGTVRGEIMVSGWVIRELEGGRCEVTGIFHSDLKGYVPSSLINALSDSVPVKMCQKIRKMAEKQQQQQ